MDLNKERELKRHTCLSRRQLRIFSLQNQAPTSTAYVESIAFKTRNDAMVINTLFDKILNIHPILKTEIRHLTANEAPVMFCNITTGNEVSIEHLRPGENVAEYISRSTPFMKMIENPLVKCRYIKTERFNVVVLHIHEIIADHIFMRRISDDVRKLLQTDETTPFVPTSSPYVTYLASEGRHLIKTNMSSDDIFWREIFKTLPPEINLSLLPSSESIWKNTMTYESKRLFKVLTTETTLAITKLSTDLGITNFVYYLSCVIVVLQRYLGVRDVTFRLPVSVGNELANNTNDLIANTLLYRTTVNHQLTWRQYIDRIKDECSSFMKHSQYPFENLEQWILETHSRPVTSFSHVTFIHNKYNQSSDELIIAKKHAQCPLGINILEDTNSGQSTIGFEWSTNLIDECIVENISCSVFELLSKPLQLEQKIVDSQVLSTSELKLINSFSHTKQQESKHFVKMHIMFESHANMFPDSVAVIMDQEKLTYRQLNEMSSRIAHGIRTKVPLQTLIAKPVLLVLNKSIMAVALVLGIWKAGGHLLSVDVSNKSPLKLLLSQTPPSAVVYDSSHENYIKAFEDYISCPVFSIHTLVKCIYGSFMWSENSSKDLNDTAYIVRTSGSTGMPKVCKISHFNLNVIARAYTNAFDIDKYPVILFQWAPMTFDAFMGDLVRGIICGPGSLVICPGERRLDVSYIQNSIRTNHVTLIELTPYFASKLIEGVDCRQFESLRVVVVSSDVVHGHLFQKLKEFFNPQTKVMNLYGMSEATIDSSMLLDDTIPSTRSTSVSIGKPLLGVNLYVLDPETLSQCPVGTIGELFIGGNVIGSGDVDLINLGQGRGVAMKTKDVCSWLPSGNIELIGRETVKFKGFRINITEIESYIVNWCRNVKEACVVVLQNEESGQQNLSVLMEIDPIYRQQTTAESVRDIISGVLPHYMIPGIIGFADAFPLNRHGKIDRKTISAMLNQVNSETFESNMYF